MRRLRRKILVAITAFGMIFGSVSSAFAASYSDVKPDSDIAGSVNRLSALGVLTGYPDGSFKPENPITRAEFAAVALRALGAEAGAEAAKGATRFSDVGADHWASGYINLAVQLGLLTGYPDGTFKPDQQVTFAESLAILVRALGYDSQVRGTWPENYLAMGSSLGLARGVTISGNAPANRGQVAVMTDNALGVKLANSNQTLVERLGVKVWDQSGFRVIANARLDKGLDPDEVKIEYEGDNDDVKDEFGTETFRLVGYNPQSLLGHEIAFWTRGNDIIYVQDRTRASDVKVGVFSLTNVDATNKTATFHVDFGYDKDDDFSLAPNTRGDADEDPVLYLNHERVTLATFLNSNPRGDGVVIVDGDDVVFADVSSFNQKIVVTDVDQENNEITGFNVNEGGAEVTVDIEDDAVGLWGQPVSAKDIKPGMYVDIDDDTDPWDQVIRFYGEQRQVRGVLDSVDTEADGDIIVTIDGQEFELASNVAWSDDGNDTAESLRSGGVVDTDQLRKLEDRVGDEFLAYFNGLRQVFFLTTEAGGAEGTAGWFKAVIVDMDTPGGRVVDKDVTVVTESGKLTKYSFTDDTRVEAEEGGSSSDGSAAYKQLSDWWDIRDNLLVELRLASDGTIDTVRVLDDINNNNSKVERKTDTIAQGDLDDDAYTVNLDENLVRRARSLTDAIVFDVRDGEEDAVDGKTFATAKFTGNLTVDYILEGAAVKYLFIVDDDLATGNRPVTFGKEEETRGAVVARSGSGGKYQLTVAFTGGETKTYEAERDAYLDATRGDVVELDFSGDLVDKVTPQTALSGADVGSTVYASTYTFLIKENSWDSDTMTMTVVPADVSSSGAINGVDTGNEMSVVVAENAVVVDTDNNYRVRGASSLSSYDATKVSDKKSDYYVKLYNVDGDPAIEFVIVYPTNQK